VTVRYFAAHREAAGVEHEVLEVPAGTRVRELLDQVFRRHPALEGLRSETVVSVNKGVGNEAMRLRDGDDVVLLPPISGG
jgi:molybdopterin synthase sulfur carrier subunit